MTNLNINETIAELEKINPKMPRELIHDLVIMYDKMDEEQRKKFDEGISETYDLPPKCDDEIESSQIIRCENYEQQDERLRADGKLDDIEE